MHELLTCGLLTTRDGPSKKLISTTTTIAMNTTLALKTLGVLMSVALFVGGGPKVASSCSVCLVCVESSFPRLVVLFIMSDNKSILKVGKVV